jgi:Protein of unknown function (DUF3106)
MPRQPAATRVGTSLRAAGRRAAVAAGWLLALLTTVLPGPLRAADPATQPAAQQSAAGGAAWASLTAPQKSALAPLQLQWPTIESSNRDKWLEVAARFPSMSTAERQRIQERMAEWSRLSPQQRGQARLQFQEARQVSPVDRQAKWEAYQALPEEQRRELAGRARPDLNNPAAVGGAGPRNAVAVDTKRNIVEPQRSQPAKPVAPTVVQARPGASTTLMSSTPSPPAHNQAGLPKIVATEGFVNPSTLLPKVGPQGAAAQAAVASKPDARQ